MTEHQIECGVSSRIDSTDRAYMAGRMTEEEYRRAMKEIDQWADKAYAEAGR